MQIGNKSATDDTLEQEDEVLNDANLEDEGLEGGDEDVLEDIDTEDEEDLEDEEDVDDPDSKETDDDAPVKFDKKQQTRVDQIVKERLERAETKLVRDMASAAGVEISREEISSAARLWGLLKSNPQLSRAVDGIISTSLAEGSAQAPVTDDSPESRTQRLELKEAILDLKVADNLFAKNADKILAWAENEGYTVTDAKTLKLVFSAWKGAQGKVVAAVQKTTAQRKQEAKKTLQKRATVQTSKPGAKSTGSTDYRKMSDKAILASEGIKLFTED